MEKLLAESVRQAKHNERNRSDTIDSRSMRSIIIQHDLANSCSKRSFANVNTGITYREWFPEAQLRKVQISEPLHWSIFLFQRRPRMDSFENRTDDAAWPRHNKND